MRWWSAPWIWKEEGPEPCTVSQSTLTPREVKASALLYWRIFFLNFLWSWGSSKRSWSTHGQCYMWGRSTCPWRQHIPKHGLWREELASFSVIKCKHDSEYNVCSLDPSNEMQLALHMVYHQGGGGEGVSGCKGSNLPLLLTTRWSILV